MSRVFIFGLCPALLMMTTSVCLANEVMVDLACPEGASLTMTHESDDYRLFCALDDGTRHGPFAAWNALTGHIEFYTIYQEDKGHGVWRTWHENGQLSYECQLYEQEDGFLLQKNPCRLWHDNGQLSAEYNFVDGLNDGDFNVYYPNGQLEESTPMDMGIIQGTKKTWYENGQLESEAEFVDDVPHGMSATWAEDGTLLETCEYDMGTLIGCTP